MLCAVLFQHGDPVQLRTQAFPKRLDILRPKRRTFLRLFRRKGAFLRLSRQFIDSIDFFLIHRVSAFPGRRSRPVLSERITQAFPCQGIKSGDRGPAATDPRFYENLLGGLLLVCRVYRAGIPSTLRFLQQ